MALEHLLQARLVEVGKIKIGTVGEARQSNSGGTWRPPVKLDHFLVTTLQRDQQEQLIADAEVMESLKEHCDTKDGKLRRLPITLLSNEIEEVMTANYVAYTGRKCAARSDGLVLTEYATAPGGAWLPKPRTVPHTPEAVARWKMKLATTLNVMVASAGSRWGGVYKFRTTSRITADQLYGSLSELRDRTGGILRGLPLTLVVRPMQVAPNGQPATVYVVHVELAGSDMMKIRELALDRLRFELSNAKEVRAIQAQYRQLLAHEPDELDDEELAGIEAATQDAEFTTVPPPPAVEAPVPTAGAPVPPPPAPAPVPPVVSPPPAAPSPPPPASRPSAAAQLSTPRPTDPPEVSDTALLRALAAKKGQTLAMCLDWLNKAFHTSYASPITLSQIALSHRRKLVEVLHLMNDAAPEGETI